MLRNSVLFRFSKVRTASPLPFSGRYLTRLLLLAGLCLVAIVALNLPRLLHRGRGGDVATGAGGSVVRTDIAPSPFSDLGAGVFVADGHPKQVEQHPLQTDPLSAESPPQVDQQLLQHVLDKTGDRSKRPFYHFINLATLVSNDVLEERARRDLNFASFWNDPEKHRGELVYLKGYLRGLTAWTPSQEEYFNPAGLETLYDGYLFTDDSRPNPYIIVVPRLPGGMPVSENMAESVSFAGYFFKLWRYQAKDGTERAAPLLVGQLLSWTPNPRPARETLLSGSLAAGFVSLVVVVGGTIWIINRRSVRSRLATPNPADVADQETLNGLAELERQDEG